MAGLEPRGRALLREYRGAKRACAAQQDAVWAQIEGTLAGTAGPHGELEGASPGPAVTRPIAWALGLALAAAVIAVVAVGTSMLGRAERQEAPLEAPDVSAPTEESKALSGGGAGGGLERSSGTVVPPATLPADSSDPPPPPSKRPSGRARGPVDITPKPRAETDGLRAEMALIAAARQALQGGQPSQALRSVQEHAETFARGQMIEDRRALRIEALCALGKARQANAEVVTFAKAFPFSAHTTRLRGMCPLP